MHIVGRSEVSYKLGTATYIDIGIVSHSSILEEGILPIHIRITLTLFLGGLITVVVDKFL